MIKKFVNLMCFFFILSIYLFDNSPNLVYISNITFIIFLSALLLKKIIRKEKIIINKYIIHFYLYLITLLIPFINSPNISKFTVGFIMVAKIFIICILVINYIDNDQKNLERIIKYIEISGFILTIYFFITSYRDILSYNVNIDGNIRFGSGIGNQNMISTLVAISVLLYTNKFITTKRFLYILCIIPMTGMILLTGSRKSLLVIVIGVIIITYMNDKKSVFKLLKLVIRFSIIGSILLFIVFKVEIFYGIIGVRIESIINNVVFGSTLSESDLLRQNLITFGVDLFYKNPIIGYGLNSYIEFYNNVNGVRLYSHSNVIELLVSCGLIGTIAYYYMNINILKNLCKKTNKYSIAIFSIIVSILIISMNQVLITYKMIYIILSIGSTILTINNSQKNINSIKNI